MQKPAGSPEGAYIESESMSVKEHHTSENRVKIPTQKIEERKVIVPDISDVPVHPPIKDTHNKVQPPNGVSVFAQETKGIFAGFINELKQYIVPTVKSQKLN